MYSDTHPHRDCAHARHASLFLCLGKYICVYIKIQIHTLSDVALTWTSGVQCKSAFHIACACLLSCYQQQTKICPSKKIITPSVIWHSHAPCKSALCITCAWLSSSCPSSHQLRPRDAVCPLSDRPAENKQSVL